MLCACICKAPPWQEHLGGCCTWLPLSQFLHMCFDLGVTSTVRNILSISFLSPVLLLCGVLFRISFWQSLVCKLLGDGTCISPVWRAAAEDGCCEAPTPWGPVRTRDYKCTTLRHAPKSAVMGKHSRMHPRSPCVSVLPCMQPARTNGDSSPAVSDLATLCTLCI